MAREDAIITTNVENGVLTINVKGLPTITVDPADYPDELVQYAALHGFKQKYVDAAALGAGATPREKYDAIKALVTYHRDTGEWNRTQAGDGTSGDGLLVRAIMEATGVDRDTARTAVGRMDKPTQHAMRQSPQLRPIIERLRVVRTPKAKPGFDAAAVLAGIGRA